MTAMLKANEIADLLRVSEKTIYSWTSQRLIPHIKLRGRIFFEEQEVEEWRKQFRVKPQS
ncbi:helix-turn-helix domain-containing protein [Elusimicrobiota bacterium]